LQAWPTTPHSECDQVERGPQKRGADAVHVDLGGIDVASRTTAKDGVVVADVEVVIEDGAADVLEVVDGIGTMIGAEAEVDEGPEREMGEEQVNHGVARCRTRRITPQPPGRSQA